MRDMIVCCASKHAEKHAQKARRNVYTSSTTYSCTAVCILSGLTVIILVIGQEETFVPLTCTTASVNCFRLFSRFVYSQLPGYLRLHSNPAPTLYNGVVHGVSRQLSDVNPISAGLRSQFYIPLQKEPKIQRSRPCVLQTRSRAASARRRPIHQ